MLAAGKLYDYILFHRLRPLLFYRFGNLGRATPSLCDAVKARKAQLRRDASCVVSELRLKILGVVMVSTARRRIHCDPDDVLQPILAGRGVLP
jgi:hypothetical protein